MKKLNYLCHKNNKIELNKENWNEFFGDQVFGNELLYNSKLNVSSNVSLGQCKAITDQSKVGRLRRRGECLTT